MRGCTVLQSVQFLPNLALAAAMQLAWASPDRASQGQTHALHISGIKLHHPHHFTTGLQITRSASDSTVAMALTFSAATLLYLVSEELLIEAHEHGVKESPFSALVLFAGFTPFWGLQLFS